MIKKIEWALDLPGIDAKGLRDMLGLKSGSAVSEWKRTGRIAKRHLPSLARATGTVDGWWLDDAAPIPPTGKWLANQAALEITTRDPAQIVGSALSALAPILMRADKSTRQTVGLLLSRWAESPDGGGSMLAIQTLLAPHASNASVEQNFGSVHKKARE